MVYVKIISSNSKLNFEGEWQKNENPESVLEESTREAKENGIPVMVTIENHGTYSISPDGQVLRGKLYDINKLDKQNKKYGKK